MERNSQSVSEQDAALNWTEDRTLCGERARARTASRPSQVAAKAAQVVCADLSRVKLQTLSSASAFVHGGCVRGACVYDGRWEVKEACGGRCPDFNMRHVERACLSAATLPSWHFFLGGFALSLPAATRNGWCTWAR